MARRASRRQSITEIPFSLGFVDVSGFRRVYMPAAVTESASSITCWTTASRSTSALAGRPRYRRRRSPTDRSARAQGGAKAVTEGQLRQGRDRWQRGTGRPNVSNRPALAQSHVPSSKSQISPVHGHGLPVEHGMFLQPSGSFLSTQ